MNSNNEQLSLLMAIAVVAGTMIGSGVFLLPASLASYGAMGFGGWIFTAAGAVLLALSFSRLSKRYPKTGGPYVFARYGLGEFAGFLVGWGFWISLLIGGAAIAVAAVGYLGFFVPEVANRPGLSAIIALGIIWIIAGINLSGIRNMGKFQVVTTVLKITPLLMVIIAALFYFQPSHFDPINPTGQSDFSVILTTGTLTLWAFIGFETISVVAENVENPTVNVGKAMVYGTLFVALIYLFSTFCIMGILPREVLAQSTAPFSEAASKVFGDWVGYLVAGGAVISCVGALNGLILAQGQLPFAVARDGLFPKPLSRLNSRGTPGFALITSAIITTVFMIMNYSKGLVELFTFMILISTFSMLLPYSLSALAEIVLLWKNKKGKELPPWRTLILASLAFFYSIWVIIGAGISTILWGLILLAAGLPVYWIFKFRGSSSGNRESD